MATKKKPIPKTKPAKKKTTPKTKPAAKKKTTPKSKSADMTSDEALRALPLDYADVPDMPVAVMIAEIASLDRLTRSVARSLLKVGIAAGELETLGRLGSRLKGLETSWQRARAGVKLASGERQKLAEAEALDRKLLAGGRWALRKDEAAQAELGRIAEGSGLADTIADLRDLVSFWTKRAEAMKYTDITSKDLARAGMLADALDAAAAKETNSLDAATALDLRNRCFWAADALCSDIREAGRYAFRLEPKIAAKFTSRYRASASRRSRKKAKTNKTATPAPAPNGN